MAKRKSTTTASTPLKKQKKEDFFSSIVNSVLKLSENDELVASAFIKLPSKKLYPDYYEIIKEPISISEIQKKIGKYDKEEFVHDFELLLKNAATYNDSESWIVKNARKLVDFVKEQVEDEESFGKLPEICISIIEDVINYEDGMLSGPFMEEVDQSVYTDYSKFVTKPMAFNTILSNMNNIFSSNASILENFQKFHDETTLIFSNARSYNNEESQIYQDANTLESFFNEKFDEWKAKLTQEPEEPIIVKSSLNTMGKSSPTLPKENLIIQESSIFSSPQITQQISKYVQQKSSSLTLMSRDQEIKSKLFPTHSQRPLATLFSYKVPANGFVNQSYTVSLPSEVSPFISFKVSLHNLLYQAKKRDLVDGHGSLNSTEDFQCKLHVNEEEVSNGPELIEEGKVLGVQYDVKLSYGLNVLNFECKVAPNLSKKIKHTVIEENDEAAGRHTRHQLQQLKMTWDVENIIFYIVCN